jgi:sulfoquinovosidase
MGARARGRVHRAFWLALLLVSAGASAAPGGAGASVDVGSDEIVVRASDGSRAVVERSPLRISFLDSSGTRVLEQVAPNGAPQLAAPIPESQYGTIGEPGPTRYSPFAYLVGSYDVNQVEGTQWHATLQSVVKSGTFFAATDVIEATARNGGVDLVLATDEPSGRRIEARIEPARRGLAVSAEAVPSAGVAAIADSFASSPSESFRGFGGRHNQLDQRGTSFYNFLQQQNVSSGSGEGVVAPTNPAGDRYLFPNGEHAAYYVHGSFVSDAGYGFLLDRDEISHWRMASDTADRWRVEVRGSKLDYVVAPGSQRQAASAVSELNGRHRLPPKWAMGSLMVRSVNFPSDSAPAYLARVLDDIRQIEETGTPFDAYGIEGWEFLTREELADVISKLERLGIRPMLYFRLFVGRDEIGTDDPADFEEAVAKGYVATKADGQPYIFTSNFFRDAAVIDFTDADAVKWWRGRIREALELGADGFMQDFGEQVMTGMHFEDGSTGQTMHNRLPTLAHRATRKELARWKKKTGERVFFYTRAGHSGTPGAAKYEGANFAGDSTTDWTRSAGIASLATDMLNRAVSGNYGFTTDIGGYFDIGPYQSPTSKELFIRWTEWAALSPLFRLHGSVLAGTHMPWTYDDETVAIYKRYARLHIRARPYMRTLWKRAVKNGTPPIRPLWLQFPDDPEAAAQDQQWMVGPDVLVAPVVTEGAVEHRVYFPEGCWRDAETGERVRGPGYRDVPAPLGELPYFFRCGTEPF